MKKIRIVPDKKDLVLAAVFALLCVGLSFVPTGFEGRLPQDSYLTRARVLKVDNSRVRQMAIVKEGEQSLIAEILSGPCRGQQVGAVNYLTGKMELDDVLVEGRDILLEYTVQDGRVTAAVTRGPYRLQIEQLLVVLFAALLLLVAGWTGLKAMLSFLFAILMIWKVPSCPTKPEEIV